MQCDQTVDEPRLESEQILECMCASAPVNEQTSDHVQATPYTPEHIIHPAANPDPPDTKPSATELSTTPALPTGTFETQPANHSQEQAATHTPEHIIHPTANPDPHNTEPSAPEQQENTPGPPCQN